MTDKQPEALRIAQELESDYDLIWTTRSNIAAELRRLQAENEALRAKYQSACGVVASMHLAATGQTIGPKRGVVEDVEDLRAEVEELRSRLQTTPSSGESHEDSWKSCEEGQKQEPVATLWQHGETGRTRITTPDEITDCDARWFKAADLYTHPSVIDKSAAIRIAAALGWEPKREWVGLTDEDLSVCDEDGVLLALYWERVLKEKNT